MSLTGKTTPAFVNPDPEVPTVNEKIKPKSNTGKPSNLKMIPQNSGLYHTIVPIKELNFKIAPNSSVIAHHDSWIVLGSDRPSTLVDGQGAQGIPSATIDLVVGRGTGARGGKGLKPGTYAGNLFAVDAARVYISQLTDMDKNMGLASGVPGRPTKSLGYIGSAVGIKADDVRLFANNSLKIVTGRGDSIQGVGKHGEPNSRGGPTPIGPTIQLIAGNYSDAHVTYGGIKNPWDQIAYLQPIPKGHNVVIALRELYSFIGTIWSAVYNLALIQTGYNAINSVDALRPWVATAGPVAGQGALTFVLQALWSSRVKGTMWEQNYVTHHAPRYILSPNVWTT